MKKCVVCGLFAVALLMSGCGWGSTVAVIEYAMVSWNPPASGVTDDAIAGDFTFENTGQFDGVEAVTWELYVSADAAFDDGDIAVGSGTTDPLGANSVSTATPFSGSWVSGSAGTYPKSYYLILRLSASDDIGTGSKELVSDPIPVRLSGRIIFNDLSNDYIWIINTDGSEKTQVGTVTVNPSPVSFSMSPDYSTVVYVPVGTTDEIWTISAVDVSPVPSLLYGPVSNTAWSPQFSPDGSRVILFDSAIGTDWVYIIDSVTGTEVDSANVDYNYLSWSPDGTKLSYFDNDTFQIGTANADLSGWTPLSPAVPSDFARAAWSPDGTKLLYAQGGDIYETSVSGGPGTLLVPATVDSDWISPCYSPDGSHIAYADAFAFIQGIVIADSDGSNPQVIPGTTDASTSVEWR